MHLINNIEDSTNERYDGIPDVQTSILPKLFAPTLKPFTILPAIEREIEREKQNDGVTHSLFVHVF